MKSLALWEILVVIFLLFLGFIPLERECEELRIARSIALEAAIGPPEGTVLDFEWQKGVIKKGIKKLKKDISNFTAEINEVQKNF